MARDLSRLVATRLISLPMCREVLGNGRWFLIYPYNRPDSHLDPSCLTNFLALNRHLIHFASIYNIQFLCKQVEFDSKVSKLA